MEILRRFSRFASFAPQKDRCACRIKTGRDRQSLVAALFLLDHNHLFAPIRAAAHADVMGALRLTAPLTGSEILRRDLPLTATLATSRLGNPYFWYCTHCPFTLPFFNSLETVHRLVL